MGFALVDFGDKTCDTNLSTCHKLCRQIGRCPLTEPRSYNSPTRDQAKVETRDAILEATVKVIIEEGIVGFTVENVAKAAGVSHRTVYRHFDSREAILEGLQDMLFERQAKAGLKPPKDAAHFVEIVGRFFEEFSKEADAMRASVIAATALRHQTKMQSQSFALIERALQAEYEHIPPSEIRDAAAAIRSITGRYGWYVMAVDMELSGKECARAATFAVRAMVQDLERRNAELAPSAKPSRAAVKKARLPKPKKRGSHPKEQS